jgi:AraC-like DNA-binding protein
MAVCSLASSRVFCRMKSLHLIASLFNFTVLRRLQKCFLILILGYLSPIAMLAQSENVTNLLHEADSYVITAPEKAIKLSEYVLKSSPEAGVAYQAKLVKAKAHSSMGRTDLAMEWAFQAVYDALPIGDEPAFKTQFFAFHLFHTLGIPTKTVHFPALKMAEGSLQNPDMPDYYKKVVAMEKAQLALIADDTLGAIKYLKTAQAHTESTHERVDVYGDPTLKMAWIYLNNGKTDSVEQLLVESDKVRPEQTKTNLHLAELLLLKGAVLTSQGFHNEAIDSLNKALEISNELGNSQLQVQIYHRLLISFRALENGEMIRKSTEEMYSASSGLEEIQNTAINTGHAGMIKLQTEHRRHIESRQTSTRWIAILVLAGLVLITGIVLLKNKISAQRLGDIVKYLEASQKINEPKDYEPKETDAVRVSSFSKSTEELLIHGLEEFERSEKYLNNDMSLAQLATLLDTNTKYLSEFINLHKGKNFNTYINELRIGYIMHKLKSNPTYLSYKVSYLAEESGFSSHSNFTTVFKTISGISPTKFISLIQLEKENKFSEV